MRERVTGRGGLFFKAEDPEKLYGWYEKHLGLKRGPDEAVTFWWRSPEDNSKEGKTVWAIFPMTTT